jgi:Family of unknown function (DUF5519)
MTVPEHAFPVRRGPRPRTTATNPHTQLDQQPDDPAVRELLLAELALLPGVAWRPSAISVPGAEALWLADDAGGGPPEAFMIGREFAHLHPVPDRSLHVMVPQPLAEQLIAEGWGELHPVARMGLLPRTAILVYAPRDDLEVAVVARIVGVSHAFASGQTPAGAS